MIHLKDLIIDIGSFNPGDEAEGLILRTAYNVTVGIDEYLDVREGSVSARMSGETDLHTDEEAALLITDNITAKNKALSNGIGIALYDNGSVDSSQFHEALYCIDSILDMTDETLNRMYERAAGIPWTILETERCIVREITTADVKRLYEIYSDEETKRYIEDLYDDYERELEFTRDYINNQYRFYEYGLWVVILKESGVLIGRAGIFDREGQDNTELGFVFDKNYSGMGLASEVLTAIIEYADRELAINELVANVLPGNEKSVALLEKLGFWRDGVTVTDDKTFLCFRNRVKIQ